MENLLELKEELDNRSILYCFCGPISHDIIVGIANSLKNKMKLDEVKSSTIIKVFSIVIEMAQNIYSYSDEETHKSDTDKDEIEQIRSGVIVIGFRDQHYYILCGNIVKNENIEHLTNKITKVQSMDKEQLKLFYKEQRKKEPDKNSKGAGIGFIEIARKTSKPIEFDFKKINDELSFYSMKTYV